MMPKLPDYYDAELIWAAIDDARVANRAEQATPKTEFPALPQHSDTPMLDAGPHVGLLKGAAPEGSELDARMKPLVRMLDPRKEQRTAGHPNHADIRSACTPPSATHVHRLRRRAPKSGHAPLTPRRASRQPRSTVVARRLLLPAIVAMLMAVSALAGVMLSAHTGDSRALFSACDNTMTGIGIGNVNTVACEMQPRSPDQDSKDAATATAIFRNAAPAGGGPWPFVVLNDQFDGKNVSLWVRNSPTTSGQHIGLALHASTLWVECAVHSGFNPDPSSGGGDRWLRVRWSGNTVADDIGSSSPGDPYAGYVYGAYAAPSGSNGDVPTCF